MAFKIVLLFAFVAAATAGIIQEPAGYYQHQSAPQYYQQPQVIKQLVQPTLVKQIVSAESPANYDFNYSVHDEHTGDIKQQQESAKNGVISGQYSLIDADGYRPGYYQQQSAPQYYQQPQLIKQLVQPTLVKKLVAAEEPANYEFNYSVHDEHTGDIKQQQEKAHNGAIVGQYSLIDADGYRRIVDYTADDVHGFNAQVRREPLNQKVITKVVAPVHIAQPQYISAPTVTKVISQPQYLSSHANPALNPWAPAPVKYVHAAPQYYSAPAPVKYVAPVVAKVVTPIVAKYESAPITTVSFSGPSSSYHY
ncbi:unnamed protein product [Diamesa tonsa]